MDDRKANDVGPIEHLFLPEPERAAPVAPRPVEHEAGPLAFLPDADASGVVSVSLPKGSLKAGSDRVVLREGSRENAIDLTEPFRVFVSRSHDHAEADLFHLELRQRGDRRDWTRLGLSSRTDTFAHSVRALPVLSRRFAFVGELEMRQVLALVRGAMAQHGREDWGHVDHVGGEPSQTPLRGVSHHVREAVAPSRLVPGRGEILVFEGDDEVTVSFKPRQVADAVYFGGVALVLLWMAFKFAGLPIWALVALTGCGLFMGYRALVATSSHVSLTASRGVLERRTRPFPVPIGNYRLPVADIRQIYCKEHVFRNRSRNRQEFSYEVWVQLDGGRLRRLVSRLPEPEHALLVERTLEEFLGIKDREVAGEMEKG